MKQKWHKEIKAWADGVEIEYRVEDSVTGWGKWRLYRGTDFLTNSYRQYRIKPPQHCCCDKQTCSALKEPQYLFVYDTEEGIKLGTPGSVVPVKNLNGKFKLLGAIKLEEE
jgi:hypothetical protein